MVFHRLEALSMNLFYEKEKETIKMGKATTFSMACGLFYSFSLIDT